MYTSKAEDRTCMFGLFLIKSVHSLGLCNAVNKATRQRRTTMSFLSDGFETILRDDTHSSSTAFAWFAGFPFFWTCFSYALAA
jgi:hypothetical protein